MPVIEVDNQSVTGERGERERGLGLSDRAPSSGLQLGSEREYGVAQARCWGLRKREQLGFADQPHHYLA